MFDFTLGGRSRNCAGVTRRDAIRVGTLSLGGLSMTDAMYSRSIAAQAKSSGKSVICFWLDGGPTHMDTYDPKPEAPAEYKGPFGAIATSVPGVYLSDQFPNHAAVMDRMSIVRSVYHNNGDHFAAAHWMWTGYHGSNAANREPQFPGIGAVTAKHNGSNRPGVPASVAIPYAMTVGIRPGYQSGAFLGVAANPFDTGADPNSANFKVQNLAIPTGINAGRIDDRKTLLSRIDRVRKDIDSSGLMDGMDSFNQDAFELMTSAGARQAFDIQSEDPRLRDRYGRNSVGQGALLARRLVEAGVSFVTVHSGGWDNHSGIENAMKNGHAPRMDNAVPSLIEDLEQRGLLDDVIVMVMGEFGRTPKVNGGAGRDHWGNSMSVLLAGGGIRPGQIVGATDAKGTRPIQRAVKPAHILHTVYHQLGIDTSISHLNRAGRPIPILNEGEAISELL
jgi:hypothetical protein